MENTNKLLIVMAAIIVARITLSFFRWFAIYNINKQKSIINRLIIIGIVIFFDILLQSLLILQKDLITIAGYIPSVDPFSNRSSAT